jgi:hypothetical protein
MCVGTEGSSAAFNEQGIMVSSPNRRTVGGRTRRLYKRRGAQRCAVRQRAGRDVYNGLFDDSSDSSD